ncbi:hypothetical protein FRB90_011012 [Tulasnella sp. 427]|nr:hypothetical protein FRB90_011012 [Tulasnella sp. 427]
MNSPGSTRATSPSQPPQERQSSTTPLISMAQQAKLKREHQRAEVESELAALGRIVARYRKMYGSTRRALQEALEASESEQEERRQNPLAPDPHQEDIDILNFLTEHYRRLPGLLNEAIERLSGPKAANNLVVLARQIDTGWTEARNTDTAALRKALAANFYLTETYDQFGHWRPALNPKAKGEWGLNHPQLRLLIAPIRETTSNDEEDEELLQPGAAATYTDWFNFMFEGRQHNPQNLDEGFLRSDLLKKAFLFIYFGNVAQPMPSRITGAHAVGFTRTTVHAIAYTTTLLRFVLSSELRIDQGFNSYAFYQYLVAYLQLDDQKELTDELLRWWDHNVFPAGVGVEPPEQSQTDLVWERAIRQRAERQRAARGERQEAFGDITNTTGSPAVAAPSVISASSSIGTSRSEPGSLRSVRPPRVTQTGHEELDGSGSEDQEVQRPTKKTRPPQTRIPTHISDGSDIDGVEVSVEQETPARIDKQRKGKGKEKAVASANHSVPKRASTRTTKKK